MLDQKTQSFPDFGAMVQTLNQSVTKDEEDLLRSTFNPLMDYQIKHGCIDEYIFDHYGYPQDKDEQGKVYTKYGVCESYQRAKNLIHPWVCKF